LADARAAEYPRNRIFLRQQAYRLFLGKTSSAG